MHNIIRCSFHKATVCQRLCKAQQCFELSAYIHLMAPPPMATGTGVGCCASQVIDKAGRRHGDSLSSQTSPREVESHLLAVEEPALVRC